MDGLKEIMGDTSTEFLDRIVYMYFNFYSVEVSYRIFTKEVKL